MCKRTGLLNKIQELPCYLSLCAYSNEDIVHYLFTTQMPNLPQAYITKRASTSKPLNVICHMLDLCIVVCIIITTVQ